MMTWGEFKALAEERGVQDSDTVFYIDTGNYPMETMIDVNIRIITTPHEPDGREVSISG